MRASRPLLATLRVASALAGLALLAIGVKATFDGLASTEWDVVNGTWATDVPGSYRYRVADDAYVGTRERFGALPSLSRPSLEPPPQPGTAVEIRYDPANPGRAVLEPGVQRSALVLAGLGTLLLVLAAVPSGSRRRRGGERSVRAEGLIPSTFEATDPTEEHGWSGRKDLDESKRNRFGL